MKNLEISSRSIVETTTQTLNAFQRNGVSNNKIESSTEITCQALTFYILSIQYFKKLFMG